MSRLFLHRKLAVTLLLLSSLFILFLVVLSREANTKQSNPVTDAWTRARSTGSYHFASDITQVTIPTAKITNVGNRSHTEQLHLEGEANLRDEAFEIHFWSEGGSLAQIESGVAVRIVDGKTFVRTGANDWQERADLNDTLALQADYMAYLTAVQDVTILSSEIRSGISFTRYHFTIDSLAFANHVREQMEQALRSRGELPLEGRLNVPSYYRDMTGEGELWIRRDGLPLRQILNLNFPKQRDATVHAQITVDYSQFGQSEPTLAQWWRHPLSVLHGLSFAHTGAPLILLVMGISFVMVILYNPRNRQLYLAVALILISSLILSPLLNTNKTAKFFDAQVAKAAAQEEQQNESDMARQLHELDKPQFDPHQNPLEAGGSDTGNQLAVGSNQLVALNSLSEVHDVQLLADNGMDTDQDGLTDFIEERIGTDPTYADTDEDGIADAQEVQGFQYGGQTWYTDPFNIDSNNDSLSDLLEWDRNEDGAPDDMDNDGVPDLFDDDNDGDGVPDRKDSTPMTPYPTVFTEHDPFQLTVRNLELGVPTFVDFQLRPQNANHLWFAFNVLDWPADHEGQWQDVDNQTFADVAAVQGNTPAINDNYGDLKLIPMLEIRIKGSPTNLPPQHDLTPYNIAVNDVTADGGEKVAYVPLSILSDEQTGQRVAFVGRMYYQPNGDWPTPHSVRLVWMLQGLMDIPCNATASTAEYDCPVDGYIHNSPQIIQSYYDDWTLTGLSVREDHGVSMGIIYEDPIVDSATHDDAALWLLSYGLDNSLLAARDQDQDGKRDVTLAEVERRFDHTRNSDVPETERWAIPNILRVEKQDYATFDQAVAATAMTETLRILDNAFSPVWAEDNTVNPLLMFVHEARYRGVGFDGVQMDGSYVTLNEHTVVFDLNPSDQPAITLDVLTGVKWTPYCAPLSATPAWTLCALDDYWNTLTERGMAADPYPGDDPNDSDLAGGRIVVTNLYAISLIQGVNIIAQSDDHIISGRYSLPTDSNLEAFIRTASSMTVTAAKVIANKVVMARFVDKVGFLEYLGRIFFKEGTIGPAVLSGAKFIWSRFPRVASRDFAAYSMLAIVAVEIVIGLIAYFYSTNPSMTTFVFKITAAFVMNILSIGFIISNILTTRAWVNAVKTAGESTRTALKMVLFARSEVLGYSRAVGIIGTVLVVAITWAFFIYGIFANHISPFSPEFNSALAETIAATIYIIVLAILSAYVIGIIIVAVVAVIDSILTSICELGVDALRKIPGFGGACFTLGTAAIKVAAKVLYAFDVMVDTDRDDLVVAGEPTIDLADPNLGYTSGNTLTIAMPVTTTIVQKDPDPTNWQILPYLWFYTESNLRSTTFRYSLTQPEPEEITVERKQMNEDWQSVQDHTWTLIPMYRGQMTRNLAVSIPLDSGLDRPVEPYFNLGYALPAYECWSVPNLVPPYFPQLIPVCYLRTMDGNDSTKMDMLKFDTLPPTLDGFMTTVSKGDGGLGLAWDTRFLSLYDADGDGLRAGIYGGLDPNDALADTDGDGLTDAFELEQQKAGNGGSPILVDTDADGLTDNQEFHYGTDPERSDSDNDGLTDGEEVWHQRAGSNVFEGGWDITVVGKKTVTVHVSSNPRSADSDGDGISDQAERALALAPDPTQRVDKLNRPYHPDLFNTPPVAVFPAISDNDGFVRPGQSFDYTNTVVAYVALAPGVLDVTTSPALGNSPAPYKLNFDPLTFTNAQTVTIVTHVNGSTTPVTQQAALNSTVRTRLPSSKSQWIIDPKIESQLSGFSSKALFLDVVPIWPDRQDTYLLSVLTFDNAVNAGGKGDIWRYILPNGQTGPLENDQGYVKFQRGFSPPSSACNDSGACMVVWDQIDKCNTVTINSLKATQVGGDHDTPGIEVAIYFVADGANDFRPTDGGYELLWASTNNGGNDMREGDIRGPRANGFPIQKAFCGTGRLEIYEYDGKVSSSLEPSASEWDKMDRVGNGFQFDAADSHTNFSFVGTKKDCRVGSFFCNEEAFHTIDLNLSFVDKGLNTIGGAFIAPNGQVKPVEFPATSRLVQRFQPVAASDGISFVVGAEQVASSFQYPVGNNFATSITLYSFDGNGQPTSASFGPVPVESRLAIPARLKLALLWNGSEYRLAWRVNDHSDIYFGSVSPNGSAIPTAQVVSDAAIDNGNLNFSLAYDPVTSRTMLVYRQGKGLSAQFFDDLKPMGGAWALSNSKQAQRPRVVWNPLYQGWLVSWATANGDLAFLPLQSEGGQFLASTSVKMNAGVGSALACPAANSAPVVDLRFEELPGATTFVDSSGFVNHATCVSCPVAGVTSAPNAPLSDYAIRFEPPRGDATLNLARPVQDDFTIAFWLKTSVISSERYALVDAGIGKDNGFGLELSDGKLRFTSGTKGGALNGFLDLLRLPSLSNRDLISIGSNINIADDQWHFVAVTRQRTSGQIALYLDGEPIGTGIGNKRTLDEVAKLTLGGKALGAVFPGELDHLQIFPTQFREDTIKALYKNTLQSYCVAAATNATSNILWNKVLIHQPDNRGGSLTANAGITVTIDADLPSATVTSLQNAQYIQGATTIPATIIIGGSATDVTSGIAKVEVSVNDSPYQAAIGAESWTFPLQVTEGEYDIKTRSYDVVGNIGDNSLLTVIADGTPPEVAISSLPTQPLQPFRTDAGQWSITLSGTVHEPVIGMLHGSGVKLVEVLLKSNVAGTLANDWQPAILNGEQWTLNYVFPMSVSDPTGMYTLFVRAADAVGNITAGREVATELSVDSSGPDAALDADTLTHTVISDTLTLTGIISDIGMAGVDKLDVAFTPINQVVTEPNFTDRPWRPATLAKHGAGVLTSVWDIQVPSDLEGLYQLDLRGIDTLGNVSLSGNVWRGVIDTRAPRVAITVQSTGAGYFDETTNQMRYPITVLCAAQDLFLSEDAFNCPGDQLPPAVRSFVQDPVLQEIFPDYPFRDGFAISYTLWVTNTASNIANTVPKAMSTTPNITAQACDIYGKCAGKRLLMNSGQRAALSAAALSTSPPSAEPVAMIVAPTNGSLVAAPTGVVSVTIAADATYLLRELSLLLDDVEIKTIFFAQTEAISHTQLTVPIMPVGEGAHTLAVRVTDHAGSVQELPVPTSFLLDTKPPEATIITTKVTISDTVGMNSNILRFRGTANDNVCLAAVQLRINDQPFVDVAFGQGEWRTAQLVNSFNGKTLSATARAIDCSGQNSEVTQTIETDLSEQNQIFLPLVNR